MSRKLVWIEQQRFRGFGCSECAWVFNPSSASNFELQRDKKFTSHICADHPLNDSECHDWEKQKAITRALRILSLLRGP
jgi:hypothetical protein